MFGLVAMQRSGRLKPHENSDGINTKIITHLLEMSRRKWLRQLCYEACIPGMFACKQGVRA